MKEGTDRQQKDGDLRKSSSPKRNPQGRDELNLAEFPLCCIADRVEPGQKSLRFEDRTWDKRRGEMITRKLTITGSDEYGLPTALDDEVLLGLIQLSKFADFADRRVFFTRYQLLRLLYWTDDGKSYRRLETSLNRWVGVTLYYQNAWWNRADSCWVDEKFHVLDNVTLYDREKARSRRSTGHARPCSSFRWNDVIYGSFKAGNLKGIDFEFFRQLESAVAKRLYRFLDKRFFHSDHWEFNLKELAWEHVGLARSYDVANLKRKLRPAIEELERLGFLKPMADSKRFRKIICGDWRAIFERQRPEVPLVATPAQTADATRALTQAMVERGVTRSTAADLATRFPPDQIRNQLEFFDWLRARGDRRASRNPAGFLVSSIKGEYAPPKEFVWLDRKARRAPLAEMRPQTCEIRQSDAQQKRQEQECVREEASRRFWNSFSSDDRRRLEEAALESATPFDRKLLERGGTIGVVARKTILDDYASKMLTQASLKEHELEWRRTLSEEK